MTQPIDQLIFADWVIPILPENTVYQNYGIAIHEQTIIDIDNQDILQQKYQAKHHFQLDHHVLIPGLINAHTHAAMNLLKGFADDLPLMHWLEQHIWPAENQHVSEPFVYDGSLLAIAEMLKGGTSCFTDMYFLPQMLAKAVTETGIRANIGLVVSDFASPWAQGADDYIQKGLEVYDNYKHYDTLRFCFAPHAPYTVSDVPLKKIATLSQELDLNIHMHVHETQDEIQQSLAKYGHRPLQRLKELGLLSPAFQAVHMTQINDDDLHLIKEHGIHVVHCPQSNMKLASGTCPTSTLLQHSISLALGTDGSASNNDLDMFSEMQTAALLAKLDSSDASSLPAFEVLKMATLGGAQAMGIEDICGSLTTNKRADICAVDLHHMATQPVFDPIAQLVYAASRDQVTHLWVDGALLLQDKQLLHLNEKALIQKAQKWQTLISESH